MNLPKTIANLVKAQGDFDAAAYANCFTDTAVVFDEGKTHNGRAEIKDWIGNANKKYQTQMTPLEYQEMDSKSVLTAEISGNFPGSPAILHYHFEWKDGLIQSLKTM